MVRKPILRSRKKAGSGFGGTVWAPGGEAAPGRRSRLPRQKEPGELLSSLCICHTLPFKCQTPESGHLECKREKGLYCSVLRKAAWTAARLKEGLSAPAAEICSERVSPAWPLVHLDPLLVSARWPQLSTSLRGMPGLAQPQTAPGVNSACLWVMYLPLVKPSSQATRQCTLISP